MAAPMKFMVIFVDENDLWEHTPLYEALVRRLRGSVSHLLIEEKTASIEPAGGTTDGRGSRKVSTLSE